LGAIKRPRLLPAHHEDRRPVFLARCERWRSLAASGDDVVSHGIETGRGLGVPELSQTSELVGRPDVAVWCKEGSVLSAGDINGQTLCTLCGVAGDFGELLKAGFEVADEDVACPSGWGFCVAGLLIKFAQLIEDFVG
jgi:hypothetical protein